MYRLAVVLALFASASAFAPISKPVSRTAVLSASSPDGLGIDPGPLGLFDPLGMLDDSEGFARRRAVEIKHGRISMIAFIGMMVQELGITFPGSMTLNGDVPFSSVLDNGMGFPALANVPTFGLAQILP